MIENTNSTNSVFVDEVYEGVGTVNIVAVNPNNAKLRELGRNIPLDAEEPKYVNEREVNGEVKKSWKVRLMAQVQDLEDKPIIPMDFYITPDVWLNGTGDKCQIIDAYGRTAWATRDEAKNKKIPQYEKGPADIDAKYKYSHRGEEDLVKFLIAYLNMTPYYSFNPDGTRHRNANPGKLTIDYWDALCAGDGKEIQGYVDAEKDNTAKVMFGYREDPETNKKYQIFFTERFFSPFTKFDVENGVYTKVQNALDKYLSDCDKRGAAPRGKFNAGKIHKWVEEPTEVTRSEEDEIFNQSSNVDDLPF